MSSAQLGCPVHTAAKVKCTKQIKMSIKNELLQRARQQHVKGECSRVTQCSAINSPGLGWEGEKAL